eukprot:3844393-Heterocapsa_arctica.AAC.1
MEENKVVRMNVRENKVVPMLLDIVHRLKGPKEKPRTWPRPAGSSGTFTFSEAARWERTAAGRDEVQRKVAARGAYACGYRASAQRAQGNTTHVAKARWELWDFHVLRGRPLGTNGSGP